MTRSSRPAEPEPKQPIEYVRATMGGLLETMREVARELEYRYPEDTTDPDSIDMMKNGLYSAIDVLKRRL